VKQVALEQSKQKKKEKRSEEDRTVEGENAKEAFRTWRLRAAEKKTKEGASEEGRRRMKEKKGQESGGVSK
jgi:hypothetical protein